MSIILRLASIYIYPRLSLYQRNFHTWHKLPWYYHSFCFIQRVIVQSLHVLMFSNNHRDTNPPPLTLHCFCYQFMKFLKKSSSWRNWIHWRSVVISIYRGFFETTDMSIETTVYSKILKSFVLSSWRSLVLRSILIYIYIYIYIHIYIYIYIYIYIHIHITVINMSFGTLLSEYLTIKYITEIRNHA